MAGLYIAGFLLGLLILFVLAASLYVIASDRRE